MFGAVGDPFHRPLEPLRRHRRQRIFAERKQFGAEAAAGVGIDDPHFFRRNFEDHVAQHVADAVRPLAAQSQREAVVAVVVFGNHRTRIEIVGDKALVDDGQRDGLGRHRKRLVGFRLVADGFFERQIARLVRPHQRRAGLKRRDGVDHRRHRLPIDRDGFRGVLRLLDRVGDDECDRVADVADFLAGENFIRWRHDGHAGDRKHQRQLAKLGGFLRCENEAYAGHCAGLFGVGNSKFCECMRRTQHHRVERPGRRIV